jgi:DNA repair exonuclease SbcCD ATPase subunit
LRRRDALSTLGVREDRSYDDFRMLPDNTKSEPSKLSKDRQGEEALGVEIRELARRGNGDADLVNDDAKLASNNLGTLMRRMSLTSTREIDSLMSELKALRQKVVIDGDRVERQLAEYAELNQSVTQLTKIISDGLTHLKREPTLPKAKALEQN